MKHCRVEILLAGAWCSFLMGAAHGQVMINEVLATNRTVHPLAAEPVYSPPYVELFNASAVDVDLGAGGWSLVATRTPATHVFAAGTVIPGRGHLLLFCDSLTNLPGWHTHFSIDPLGDTVLLLQGTATNDVVRYGLQVPDHAVGRVPDGMSDSAFTLTVPSPWGGNQAASFETPSAVSNQCTLKINEWMALDTTGRLRETNDWFEVYNPGTNVVLLGGLVFADARSVVFLSNPILVPPVAPLSFIGPGGFVQFYANDGDAPDEVKFSLSSVAGDEIHLFASDRATAIDHVAFGPQRAANIPRSRYPDGGWDRVELPSASPLESNHGRTLRACQSAWPAQTW